MISFLTFIFWLGVAWAFLTCLLLVIQKQYRGKHPIDSVYFIPTEDGWGISLWRHRKGPQTENAPPVILCHGAGLGGFIFDLDEDLSIAQFLTDNGYDVWTLNLRGRELPILGTGNQERFRPWTFDDYLEFDVPAALRAVCHRTGAAQLHWIGLGLGGVLGLAACCMEEGKRYVKSVSILGGTIDFSEQRNRFQPKWVRLLRLVRLDWLSQVFAPLIGRPFSPFLSILANRDNVDVQGLRRALVSGARGFSRAELFQYAEWLEYNLCRSNNRLHDYRRDISQSTVPTQFIAGPYDHLAPFSMVKETFNSLEEMQDKELIVASRENGFSATYGHLDLLIGRNVRRDIFPYILSWLDQHADNPERSERLSATQTKANEPSSTWDAEIDEPMESKMISSAGEDEKKPASEIHLSSDADLKSSDGLSPANIEAPKNNTSSLDLNSEPHFTIPVPVESNIPDEADQTKLAREKDGVPKK